MLKIEFDAKVNFYPYRSAHVYGVFFEMDRYSEDAKKFEEKLNKMAGEKYIDNHTAYTITNRNGDSIHVSCSDMKIRFGSVLKEEVWQIDNLEETQCQNSKQKL